MSLFSYSISVVLGLVLCACTPFAAVGIDVAGSLGKVSKGILQHPVQVVSTASVQPYNRVDRNFTTASLARLVDAAAVKTATARPGDPVLTGDFSAVHGGRVSGHVSHRTGLDVDIAFFMKKRDGNNDFTYPLKRCDHLGICVDQDGRRVSYFDIERNWLLVEALLTDSDVDVQWIFVSNGVKLMLLNYAMDTGRSLELVYRAAHILRQPAKSSPHDDHFHLRIYCPKTTNTYNACFQLAPVWPWVARGIPAPLSDEQLVALATDGL